MKIFRSFYLLIIIASVVLAGCMTAGIKITSNNNQINTPHYSITVPPNKGWHQSQDEGVLDLSYFEKTALPNVYIMRFSTNWVVDENMKMWTAKQVADEYRNGEEANMIMMGVVTGQYELKNVIKGDEVVGNNQFYTMSYTTIADGIEQNAFLYLHFPVERGFTRFFVALYSETSPVNESERKSFKREFIKSLQSLKMKK